MEQLSTIIFGVALLGGVYDLFTKKIPNWWTFPTMLLALGFHFWWQGWDGLGHSFLGLLLGLSLFLPLYILNIMGAGDVKLLMSIGAWGGVAFTLQVALASIAIGGVYAFFITLFSGRLLPLMRSSFHFVLSKIVHGFPPATLDVNKNHKFSFGVSITLATVAIIWLDQNGGLF